MQRAFTDDQLKEAYAAGYSTKQIAQQYGCAPWTVRAHGRRLGIGPPVNKNDIRALRRRWEELLPVMQAALREELKA